MANRSVAENNKVFTGRTAQVCSYDGTTRVLNLWTTVDIQFRLQELQVEALVINKLEFDFILSRPGMKRLRLNIGWADEVTLDMGAEDSYCVIQEVPRVATYADGVTKIFPESLCIGDCPPATAIIGVPFKLRGCTVVGRKPCSTSYENKMWLKMELQEVIDAGIIRPSAYSFVSPITVVTKEYGTLRLCTDNRLINCQTDFFPVYHT